MVKWGFSEVDADLNTAELVLAGLGGLAVVLAPLLLKVLLMGV